RFRSRRESGVRSELEEPECVVRAGRWPAVGEGELTPHVGGDRLGGVVGARRDFPAQRLVLALGDGTARRFALTPFRRPRYDSRVPIALRGKPGGRMRVLRIVVTCSLLAIATRGEPRPGMLDPTFGFEGHAGEI